MPIPPSTAAPGGVGTLMTFGVETIEMKRGKKEWRFIIFPHTCESFHTRGEKNDYNIGEVGFTNKLYK